MIERIQLSNFKIATDLSLRISPLTLLTGLNSSGKSTVMQSMALVRQNFLHGTSVPIFGLAGPLVQLGAFSDVRTHGAESDCVRIELKSSDGLFSFELVDIGAGNSTGIRSLSGKVPPQLVSDDFQYLLADRVVPQNLFPRSAQSSPVAGALGVRGEFTAERISSAGSVPVSVARRCPVDVVGKFESIVGKVAPTDALLDQVAGWLQQMSPGVRITAEEISGTDEFRLQFGYVGRAGISETDQRLRPANVGFGLTYTLPIIVACLVAKPGSVLLLENPEAHLHPRGQAAMAALIARVVADGVQVVVETHSDHVLNGVRLATKKGWISAAEVAIHYFSRAPEDGAAYVESPAILGDGRLSNWPEGFFDQMDRDLDSLLG